MIFERDNASYERESERGREIDKQAKELKTTK